MGKRKSSARRSGDETVGTESGIFVAFGSDGDDMADRRAHGDARDRAEGKVPSGGRSDRGLPLLDPAVPGGDPIQEPLLDKSAADEAPDSWRDGDDLIHGGCDLCIFCGGKNGDHSAECLDLLDSTDTECVETGYTPGYFCEFCGLCSEEAQASIASQVPNAPKNLLVTERVPRGEGETEIDFFIRVMEDMEQRWVIGAVAAFNDEGRATCPLMWPF